MDDAEGGVGHTEAPRRSVEGSVPGHEPPTLNLGLPDDPPPFGLRWNTLYAIVLGTLLALILLFYAFTKAFG